MRPIWVASLALLIATAGVAADPPGALPLDLAYSRREVPRGGFRPLLSPDGRHLAYELRTPRAETENGKEETEVRYLPNGMPLVLLPFNLWISDTETGQSRPVCKSGPCWRGSWSPSGRQLAFISGEQGAPAICIYDLASGTSRRLVTVKAKLWPGDEAMWSPDGRTLYVQVPVPATKQETTMPAPAARPSVRVLRTRDKAPEGKGRASNSLNEFIRNENQASLVAVDVATGATRVIVSYDADPAPNYLRLSPDGRWLSYLSLLQSKDPTSLDLYLDLVVVPVAGGKPVLHIRDLQLPEDESHTATYRWTPDSKRIAFVKDAGLWVADVVGGEPRHLAASLGKITPSPFYLTRDGSAAIASIDAEGEPAYDLVIGRRLAVVPLDGGAPHVSDVVGVPIPADPATVWQPTAGTFAALRPLAGKVERELLEIDLGTGRSTRVWSGPGRITPVGVVPGQNLLVTRFETTTTPADFYLFDRNFKLVRRLSHIEPRLDVVRIGSVEAFETVIGGHDEKFKTVQTRLVLPPGAKRGDSLPAVVYFYTGVPMAESAHEFGGGAPASIPVQIFVSRGYAVLLCDAPAGPSGKPGNPMQEMTEAIVGQVRHAADLGYIDIRRVALLGQSYGGYCVAAVITKTNLFRAGLALDGVYDLGGNYPESGEIGMAWAEHGQGRMGVPLWSDVERYIANSPYYQADKIHTPLLLLHGEKDSACPVIEAKKMYYALQRLDRDAELAIYAGEGHVPGRWGLANAIDATQRMLDFLAKHLREP